MATELGRFATPNPPNNRWAHYNFQVFKEKSNAQKHNHRLEYSATAEASSGISTRSAAHVGSITGGVCSFNRVDRESAIQGRWHRISGPNAGDVGDPFFSLAGEYFEFRPHGVLVRLLFDQGPQLFWTARAGEYLVSDTDQVTSRESVGKGGRATTVHRRIALA
jgi:hypothetical protein